MTVTNEASPCVEPEGAITLFLSHNERSQLSFGGGSLAMLCKTKLGEKLPSENESAGN